MPQLPVSPGMPVFRNVKWMGSRIYRHISYTDITYSRYHIPKSATVHTLFRKQNYRNIRLEQDTEHQTVGVLTRDGKDHHVRWLGFIDRAEAKQIRGRPVKLVISRVGRIDLEAGQYVQGCLVENGVYAVTDSQVAIVS